MQKVKYNYFEFKRRQKDISYLYYQIFETYFIAIARSNYLNEQEFLDSKKKFIQYISKKWFYTDCHELMYFDDRTIASMAISRLFAKELNIIIQDEICFNLVDLVFDRSTTLNFLTTQSFKMSL